MFYSTGIKSPKQGNSKKKAGTIPKAGTVNEFGGKDREGHGFSRAARVHPRTGFSP
jgi:hypothetical protein